MARAELRRRMETYNRAAQRGALRALPRGEPRESHTDLMPTYLLRPGKGIRPVLCIASCIAHGGQLEHALPIAVSLELLHSAFLIHDDLSDASPSRRGKPSMHVTHGIGIATNIGDALASIAGRHIRTNLDHLAPSTRATLLHSFDLMVDSTIDGQALDLGWREFNRFDVSLRQYLDMVIRKTSWYTTMNPLVMGALAAEADAVDTDALLRFGASLGAVFQMVNDLNGLSESARGGQAACEDLQEGKRTVALLHLHGQLDGVSRRTLSESLAAPRAQRTPEQVSWILGRMDDHGSIEYARDTLRQIATVARRDAELAFGRLAENNDREILLAMVDHVLSFGEGAGLKRPSGT